MRLFFIFIVLLLFETTTKGQVMLKSTNELLVYPESVEGAIWNPGYIILTDGNKLTGGTHFDQVQQNVYLMENEKINVFSADEVLEFTFNENKYYSLSFDENKDGYFNNFFFSLIEENPDFLVLQKISKTKVKSTSRNVLDLNFKVTYLKNTESIYLGLNDEGKIIRLGKNSKENKDILHSTYGDDFSQIETYIKENKLSFKKIDELIDALKYYYQYNK